MLAATGLWAQMAASSPSVTFSPTPTPTATYTYTVTPLATPTWTNTWDVHSTNTPSPTPTPANPASFSPTPSFTPTITGTIPPTNTYTPTLTNTPNISRASLALWPTGYTNAWDRRDGFNWDVSFTYIIGTIAERNYSKPNVDWLNPLRLWLLSSDVKYAWLEEDGDMPAVASGIMLSEFLNGGGNSTTTTTNNPGATGSGGQSFQLTGNSMGGVYTVLSKRLSENEAVHFGFVYGFNRAFHDLGIGDFGPDLSYSQLVPYTTTKLAGISNAEKASIFYTGYNTRLLGTNWKFELWKPFPMDENPVLLDTQIDGLFAFNLGFERWDHGYAVLGYFNFRFTIVPVPPDY